MNLYKISKYEIAEYVMADTMVGAVAKWNERLKAEASPDAREDEEPEAIEMLAKQEDVILPHDHDEVVNNLRIELGHAKTERNNRTADLVKVEKVLDRLQDLKSSLMNALGISHNMTDGLQGVDEKIMAELVTLKAQAGAYETYVKAKAGNPAALATTLTVQNRDLQNQLKIANDKLDAKEGHDVP